MIQPIERLWTPIEVGAFLGLSPKTIVSLASRSPHRLPPRVATMPSPRWVPEICREWALKQSGVRSAKGGRPRG